MNTKLKTYVAERESNQYVTIFDGQTLYLLENVSGKVARAALEAIQGGQAIGAAMGEKAVVIPAADITRVRTAEHDDFVQVRYRKAGSEKHYVVAMPGHKEQLELVRAIGATLPSAQEVSGPIPVALALIGPGFASFVAIGATIVFVMLAKDVASGEEIDTSGRGGAMKLLIAKVLDSIGMSGVLAIGGLALAGTLFWGYKRIKSPPILTTYELPATASGVA